MNLPGSPKLHLWVGLTISLVGVLVGGYAYTGDRAYEIQFVAVALLGFLLLVAGGVLAGYGQANRPRLGGRAAATEDEPSLVDRLKARFTGDDEEDAEAGEAASEPTPEPAPNPGDGSGSTLATVECPSCQHVFEADGDPPFTATCPDCGHEGEVDVPQAVET